MFAGRYSRITGIAQRLIVAGAVPGMQFDWWPELSGPKGLCKTNQYGGTGAFVITKKCPYPAEAMQYLNWSWDPIVDNAVTTQVGIPGVDWEWVDPNDKYYVRRLKTPEAGDPIYAGEFNVTVGLAMEARYGFEDETFRRHFDYIRKYRVSLDYGKMPVDIDIPYDMSVIRDKVPGMADIDRLIDEETAKFIMGVRPLTEYDQWLDELYTAGMQDYIDAFTEQYVARRAM
jgi:hypothetical protein